MGREAQEALDPPEIAALKAKLAENERRIQLAEVRREKKEAQMRLRIAVVERRLLEASPSWAADLVARRRKPLEKVTPSSKQWNEKKRRWERKGNDEVDSYSSDSSDASSETQGGGDRFFPDWQVYLPPGMAPG